jgi:soluble lytic murein transglycosylase-like protein
MKTLSIITLLFVFFLAPAYADIYKYLDENGVLCYTDVPFGKKADRILKDKEKDSAAPAKAKYIKASYRTGGNSDRYASDYHSIVHEKASVYHVDPSLIKAVIKTESNWNCMARSSKGAMGLMQLMPGTANDLNVHNPFDPEENIEGGTKYLKYLLEHFNGDLTLALAAYNAGPKAVEKFGYVPPFSETKQYVKKVLALYNGDTPYTGTVSDTVKEKKTDPIYKIILDDGTVLFTNSTFFSKNSPRF